MKSAMLGALVGVGLVIVAVGALGRHGEAFAERPATYPQLGSSSELIAVPGPVEKGGQWLMVVDPKRRAIGVYHIDLQSGKISLRSVRNIHWDLQMTHFDNDGLLPQEIRSLLESS